MAKPSSRPPELAVAGVVVMTAVALLAALPPVASMGLAVVAAISWCLWLDHHPAP